MTYDAFDHYCFIQYQENHYPSIDSLMKSLPEQCRAPAEAFERNLRATALTATMPYRLTVGGIWRRNFEFTLLLERIKGGRNTHARAQNKFFKGMRSEKQKELHVRHLHQIMSDDLAAEELRFAAAELLRQCTVQLWTALEIFASDIFVSLLNAKPSLAIRLMEDENTKRLFQLKGIPFDLLTEFKFDLISSMGTLLVNYHPIDTIPSMKAVFGAILPNRKAIKIVLDNRKLWLLFQRRHLIVHRRGIVDSSYLSAIGEKLSLGTEIVISPDDLERYMKLVLDAGVAIAAGVVAEVTSP